MSPGKWDDWKSSRAPERWLIWTARYVLIATVVFVCRRTHWPSGRSSCHLPRKASKAKSFVTGIVGKPQMVENRPAKCVIVPLMN